MEGVNEDKKMRLCGKKLTRALETVCQGVYQQMGKKSSNYYKQNIFLSFI